VHIFPSIKLPKEVVAKMSVLKIKDSQGNWVGVPQIKGDKGERGERGLTGQDGISPTVTITPITGGHRITITDKDGEHSADVMDGTGNVDDVFYGLAKAAGDTTQASSGNPVGTYTEEAKAAIRAMLGIT
jgi:hypothetical protein